MAVQAEVGGGRNGGASALSVPIHLEYQAGADAAPLSVRLGVPLPRGEVFDPAELSVVDALGRKWPWQAAVLASWPDRSVKWLLLDVAGPHGGEKLLHLQKGGASRAAAEVGLSALQVSRSGDEVLVRQADVEYRLAAGGEALLSAVTRNGRPCLDAAGVHLRLVDEQGVAQRALVQRIEVEADGPVRADVLLEGCFPKPGGCPLQFRARWSFVAGSSHVQCDLLIRNPRAAIHGGGLWDLGDPGSWHLRDLSLQLRPSFEVTELEWSTDDPGERQINDPQPLAIYQDSSGGERWNSANHVDRTGHLSVAFRGYQVRSGSPEQRVLAEGKRAQPVLTAKGGESAVAVTVAEFWQNFPKALRWEAGCLSAGLFPAEQRGSTELQGGEQKRHLISFNFQRAGEAIACAPIARAVHAYVDPAAIERSGAVSGFVTAIGTEQVAKWLDAIVHGDRSFEARREIIDEYGWRNFGDLYADHEATRSDPSVPFISHYNNQYDFVYGAALHALRTGDSRWHRLMSQAARHTVDIDIYHTEADRTAFNGGLFWHTDHYVPAATATHRTYSRANQGNGDYGGGPSNEHNYASGLLLHYYLTGDRESRDAVIGLADWVCAMDDGSTTLSSLVDTGPTGLASKTLDYDYHGPGRGAGNSIATLIDAYRATRRRSYLTKAEELIQRCIHPADDMAERELGQPERRWSYLVFLQILGRYLDLKQELGEIDYCFHYGRQSLLRYASWMLEHELPYSDTPALLEIPSETWSAQDVRKCHVFHLAARYEQDADRAVALRERAAFFQQRWVGDLAAFKTQDLTRPMVLVAVYGHLHDYYAGRPAAARSGPWIHDHDFGSPQRFVPQRLRVKASLRGKWQVANRELRRMLKERFGRRKTPPKGRA